MVQWGDRYFVNSWDRLFHALVILDLLLEGILIGPPQNLSFYGCGVGFGLVIGSYRLVIRRRRRLDREALRGVTA